MSEKKALKLCARLLGGAIGLAMALFLFTAVAAGHGYRGDSPQGGCGPSCSQIVFQPVVTTQTFTTLRPVTVSKTVTIKRPVVVHQTFTAFRTVKVRQAFTAFRTVVKR